MAGDSKDLRLFLAVGLADLFLEPIARFFAQYSRRFQGIKWVRPPQVHVTLHFFGQTPVEKIPQMKSVILRQVSTRPMFQIRLQDFGFFPPNGSPRVLWIGLAGDIRALTELHQAITADLKKEGFTVEERPFSPHATVGRCKDRLSDLEIGKLKEISFPATELKKIERIPLFKSHLTSLCPDYEILETFPLFQSPSA